MIQQNSPWDNIVEPSTPNHVLYSHLEFEAPISTGVRLFLTGAITLHEWIVLCILSLPPLYS